MWLSGCIQPDHNTISNFRSGKLKGRFKKIFNQVVFLLAQEGHLNIKDIYVDGTKIEANANRYTFVWGKSIKNSRERIKKQLKELWRYVETVYADEAQQLNAPDNFDAVNPEEVTKTINRINQALKGKDIDKKVKQKLSYAKNNWPKNVAKYNRQQAKMGDRNSMSKTDPDATFMRMKEDHMQNGQVSSNNQFIINYTLAQTTADTTTLIDHLQAHQESFEHHPKIVTADAGYGSEQNYTYLEDQDIEAFVKYSYFHKEQKQHRKPSDPFHPDQFHYNIEQDCYYCPMGQQIKNIGTHERRTKNGHLQTFTRYQATNCKGCPLRGSCFKAKGNKVIERNYNLIRLKAKAKEKLLSPRGIAHRKQRCWDVEAIFGNIKHNMGFKRFMLRGIDKVNTEMGLIAMVHNLKKITLTA